MEEVLKKRIYEYWEDEKIREKYDEAMERLIKIIRKTDEEYYNKTGNHFIRFIENRRKTPESIEQKLIRKRKNKIKKPLDELINDLAGVRVICFETRQIYKIVDEIKKNEEIEILKMKDYVAKPKENGYQSFHVIMKIRGVKVELQIRTILMDAWSSLDSILIYKKSVTISDKLKKDIDQFAKWSRKMDALVQKMMVTVQP